MRVLYQRITPLFTRKKLCLRFAGTVPAQGKNTRYVEDAFYVNDGLGTYVLCDGAGESYDSSSWAALVVELTAQAPNWHSPFFASLPRLYQERHGREKLPWYAHNAFERGSFTTVLAARLIPQYAAVRLLSIGDSVAFLFDNDRLIAAHCSMDLKRKDLRPQLLSTRLDLNNFIDSSYLRSRTMLWRLKSLRRPVVVLASDELAHWITDISLENDGTFEKLLQITTFEDFENLIKTQRSQGAMANDDCTMVILK